MVDTSAMDEILLRLGTSDARRAGRVPAGFAEIVGRLVLGLAVPRAELGRLGIMPCGAPESGREAVEVQRSMRPELLERLERINRSEHLDRCAGPDAPASERSGNVVPLRRG